MTLPPEAHTSRRQKTSRTVTTPRMWALGSAAVAAAIIAALHTFVRTTPTVDALMASDIAADPGQSLRMMWHGMSAIAWTYPVVLLFMWRRPAAVARPALGLIATLSGSQALLHLAAGLWVHGVSALVPVPQWALFAAVAVLAWLARPPRTADEPAPSARRGRGRLVLFWVAMSFATVAAVFHTAVATFDSWPAALLDSNTPMAPKLELYVMWLFSCVVFTAVPVALAWSLRASAAAGRFVVRYVAVLVAALMVSWATTMALGFGPDMDPIGPLSLGVLVALTIASTPPRPR